MIYWQVQTGGFVVEKVIETRYSAAMAVCMGQHSWGSGPDGVGKTKPLEWGEE